MRSIRPQACSHREAAAHGRPAAADGRLRAGPARGDQADQGRSVHGDCGALRLELLGPVRAWRGQRELRTGGPWRQAVLGMLAARDGHPVRRSELITGVWGTPPPADALYRAGRRADALAQFDTGRQLRGESGPGLRRLRLHILTADTALMTVLPPGSGLPGVRRGGLSGLRREAAAADRWRRTAARPHAPQAAR